VSAVETPPPPAQAERRCPRCGAQLSSDQEWCLDCGAAVATHVASPRGWRAPVAIIGALLALALIALVLAIVELAGDAEQVSEAPVTPTPAPTTAMPAPSATPSASPEATPSVAPADLAEWPEGKTAWTVILNSSGTREDAERLASELNTKGVPDLGVLDSNDFESLGPDSFVVFSGQFDTRAAAEERLTLLRDQAGGGSTRRIVPKQSP
jgi:hypothetical protein